MNARDLVKEDRAPDIREDKMRYHQDPPNTIKVELTEGCNLRCGMCGLQGIREKPGGPYKFLTVKLAKKIAKRVAKSGWNSKFEFALRGEPLMNPDAAEIIGVFRSALPKAQLMITSNAIPLLKKPGPRKRVEDLFDAGLNTLALDNYVPSQKAVRLAVVGAMDMDIQVTAYGDVFPLDLEEGPSPYSRAKKDEKRVIVMEDFEAAALKNKEVGTKHVNVHCGAGMKPLEEPLMQRCARPFRELIIRYDGRIALCCNSWRDEYQCGKILDHETLQEAWDNKYLMAARHKLYAADRNFGSCVGCNERTYRNGLLPDRMGKKDLREPNSKDDKVIRQALKRGPATKPVLRPWEF